jgi:hypothetical protein
MKQRVVVSVCVGCGKQVEIRGRGSDLPDGWLHTQAGKWCPKCKGTVKL